MSVFSPTRLRVLMGKLVNIAQCVAQGAFQSRRETLLSQHVEVQPKFLYQLGIVAAHFESAVKAEAAHCVRLTFRVDFRQAIVNEVGSERFFVIILLSEKLKQQSLSGGIGFGKKSVD